VIEVKTVYEKLDFCNKKIPADGSLGGRMKNSYGMSQAKIGIKKEKARKK
jgi:hypothetical protein